MSLEQLSPVVFESVSQTTLTNSVQLGSRRKDAQGYEYVYVYNDGGEQIAPTYGCIQSTGTSGYSVTITSVADVAQRFMGVVKQATIATAYYGWIINKGYCLLEASVDSTVTAMKYVGLAVNGTFKVNDQGTLTVTSGAANGNSFELNPEIAITDGSVDTASGGSFLAYVFAP